MEEPPGRIIPGHCLQTDICPRSLSAPPRPRRPLWPHLRSPSARRCTAGAALWAGQGRSRLPLLAGRWGGRGPGGDPGLRLALAGQREFLVGASLAGHALGPARRPAPLAPGSEGLSTRASSCGGWAGSPSTADQPATSSNSRQASAAYPRGRAGDLQPAMPKPPPHSPWAPLRLSLPEGRCPLLCSVVYHRPPKG
ncbi:uncharacterized protein LOC144340177 [Macaca mulatta]